MREFVSRSLFFCALFFALFLLWEKLKPTQNLLFNWDEVDYANAARKGIFVNAVEAGSLSIVQFMKIALLKKNKQEEKISALKLPEEQDDVFLMRHFHPPFPTYYWSIFAHDDGERMTENMRLGNIIWAFFCVLFSVFCLWLCTHNTTKLVFAALLMSVFFLSDGFYSAFYSVNFHTFHLPACIFFCSALVLYIEVPKTTHSFWLSFSLVLLLGTLEMGVLVAFAAMFWGLISGYRKVLFSWRKITEIFLMSTGILMVVWIGFFRTMPTAKAFMTYFYRIFAKSNEEYERVSFLDNWVNYFTQNPFLFMLIASGLIYVIFLLVKKRLTGAEMIPLLVGLTYAVVMTPFMLAGTYVLPAVGMIVFGIVFILLRKEIRFEAETGINVTACLLLVYVFFTPANSTGKEKRIFEQAEELKKAVMPHLQGKNEIYASGAHILNFYLPLEKPIRQLERFSIAQPDFYLRKSYRYVDFKPEIERGRADAILLLRWMQYPEDKLNYLKTLGFVQKDYNEWQIFIKNEPENSIPKEDANNNNSENQQQE
jgi:hypothetical protein